MTVRRRIILKNFVLLGCLLLMGAASGLGLLRMRYNLHVATDEYNELRMINNVVVTTAELKLHLMTEEPDTARIKSKIKRAIDEMDRFCRSQTEDDEPEDHDLAELAGAKKITDKLVAVLRAYEGPSAEPALNVAAQVATLDKAMLEMESLAGEMDRLIKGNQREARSRLQFTLWLIGGLAVTIVVAGALTSRSQFLSISRPVNALRVGVKRLAAAKFSERLTPSGDREFAELAEDFNRMAAELDDFYRRLEEKVEQKSKELVRSERLASVGFLAAGVAHEINNPLGIISGHAELAMRRLQKLQGSAAVQGAAEAMQIIWDEAFRCKEITERMLSLVRPGVSKREPVSLVQVVKDTANLLGGLKQYRARKVQVKAAGDDSLTVLGNATEIRQVLLNLVVNALDVVEDGFGQVIIDGRAEGSWIEVSVADNGRGMSPEILDHVFEPFFTDKRGAGSPGTGLGLSISHLIVEGHGGTIRAESHGLGKGSRFVVRLPAATQLQELAV